MDEAQYIKLCKDLTSVHAIAASKGLRTSMEDRYYDYHRKRGVKLRAKYRR